MPTALAAAGRDPADLFWSIVGSQAGLAIAAHRLDDDGNPHGSPGDSRDRSAATRDKIVGIGAVLWYEQATASTDSDWPPGGAGPSVSDRTPSREPSGPRVRREPAVGPGEAVELGGILIARPQGKN